LKRIEDGHFCKKTGFPIRVGNDKRKVMKMGSNLHS